MAFEITIPRLGWSMEEGTFSGWLKQDGDTIQCGDPLFELSFLLGFGQGAEDKFWHSVLKAVAQRFGVNGTVIQRDRMITRSIQWRYFGNIWYNAIIRSLPGFFGRSFKKILDRMESAPA